MTFPQKCLASLGTVHTGSTPTISNEKLWGGEIPFVTPSELDQRLPVCTTPRTLTAEGGRQSRLIPEGSVMVCCIGSLGKIGIAGRTLATNQQINSIEFDTQQVWPQFGYYACQTLKPKLVTMAPATTIAIVSKSKFSQLEIPVPPLPEQRRIAAILEQADALLDKRREALAQLDSLSQSIFIEMFGDARVEVNRWPVVPFDEIVLDSRIGLVRGSQELDPGHPYPYLRMNAITRDGDLRLAGALYAKATDDELALYKLRRGDFLFNTRNSKELVGKTALFRSDEQYLFNNNLLRVRFKSEANAEYVLAAFKTPFIQTELENRKSGTTNVFAVYYKDLRTLPIPLPPIVKQEIFASRVQTIQKLKAIQSASLAQLETLFASLQHRAFRGML